MYWLIAQQAFQELKTAYNSMIANGKIEPSAFLFLGGAGGDREIMSVSNGIATIDIRGVLSKQNSFFVSSTSYPQILNAIAEAEANEAITSIDLKIDSPGGQVAGLFEVTDAIAATQKPTRALVDNLAASAAFAIAAQADEIIATSRAATFGSIGVVQTFFVDDETISITSTEAPNKVPDPKTVEGQNAIRAHLDDIHNLFVGAISDGRTRSGEAVSTNDINAEYGRGGVFLAAEAQKRGMIDQLVENDGISSNTKNNSSIKSKTALGGDESKKVNIMDLETLKANNPELYRQILALGVAQERDRVAAHLVYGEKMGAMDIATKAIKDGSEVTEALRAEYITAGMDKSDLKAMGDDDDDAADDADGGDDTETDEEKEAKHLDAVFGQVKQHLNIVA